MGLRDSMFNSLDWTTFVSSSNEIIEQAIKITATADVLFVASISHHLSN